MFVSLIIGIFYFSPGRWVICKWFILRHFCQESTLADTKTPTLLKCFWEVTARPATGFHVIGNTRVPKLCNWLRNKNYMATKPTVIIIHSHYPHKVQGISGFFNLQLFFSPLLGTGRSSCIIKNRNHLYEELGKIKEEPRDEREVTHFVSARLNFYML